MSVTCPPPIYDYSNLLLTSSPGLISTAAIRTTAPPREQRTVFGQQEWFSKAAVGLTAMPTYIKMKVMMKRTMMSHHWWSLMLNMGGPVLSAVATANKNHHWSMDAWGHHQCPSSSGPGWRRLVLQSMESKLEGREVHHWQEVAGLLGGHWREVWKAQFGGAQRRWRSVGLRRGEIGGRRTASRQQIP